MAAQEVILAAKGDIRAPHYRPRFYRRFFCHLVKVINMHGFATLDGRELIMQFRVLIHELMELLLRQLVRPFG